MNKYNLIDILSSGIEFEHKNYKFDGIQIPMIQRDYAQGRKGQEEIRKRFLKSIFDALENKNALDLDFVYGSKKVIDRKEFFIPLDGQQRLTTLFLFYWYLGNRELAPENLPKLRSILKKFNYATRVTAGSFCEKICDISIGYNLDPSKEIENASWFFNSFKTDPTVQSMLVMLDEIHLEYEKRGKEDLYAPLSEVKFYVLPLDGFDLTDELYIKMNARGKQLTDFENVKADLIKWMKDENNPYKDTFERIVDFGDRKIKYHLYFELSIDNSWTDLFWKISKKNDKPKSKLVDPYILQFWNRYLLNALIVNGGLSQDTIENDLVFKELYGIQGNDLNFKYHKFDFYRSILERQDIISLISMVFENLSAHSTEISEIIRPSWDKSEKWTLYSESINQRQRILFFSVTRYFELNAFDSLKFSDWIRFVWNIIIDPNIRSVPAMAGAMRFINQLADHSSDINKFLCSTDSILLSGNATYQAQMEEEHFKAILISKSEEWKQLIVGAEAHPLFQGNIKFMLKDNADTDIDTFKRIKNSAFRIFENSDLSDKPENFLWVRALLAKSEEIKLPIMLSNGRFNNWRYLINNSLIKGMRLLVEGISENKKPVMEVLSEICRNYSKEATQIWVYPLVTWEGINRETLLGNYSESRRVQKYNNYGHDPEHVYLYNKTVWTESNILLSNCRNELASALLEFSADIYNSNEKNDIQNTYFRGWNLQLVRIVEGLTYTYSIDRVSVKVGIKSTPELEQRLLETNFDDNEKETGWICRLEFDYAHLEQNLIQGFIEYIEAEVFDKSNSLSLVNKIFPAKPDLG